MNQVARTLLNVMRIEVLLGIGLVMWVFSLEAKALDLTCFYDVHGSQHFDELRNLQPEKGMVEIKKDCAAGKPCNFYYGEVWSDTEVSIRRDQITGDRSAKEHHLIDRRTLQYTINTIINDEYMSEYRGYCLKGLMEKQI